MWQLGNSVAGIAAAHLMPDHRPVFARFEGDPQ
jgi:hypothetical protein